jgi:hypothetical protein
LLQIHTSIDQPIAVRTDPAEAPCPVTSRDAVRDFASRDFWCAARQTIDAPRPAFLLCLGPSLGEKPNQFEAMYEDWPLIVDGTEPLVQPVSNGILVNAK